MNTLIRKNIKVLYKASYALKITGFLFQVYIKSFILSWLSSPPPPPLKKDENFGNRDETDFSKYTEYSDQTI